MGSSSNKRSGPPNRPYYSNAFRNRVGGPPPSLVQLDNGVGLAFDGFARMSDFGRIHRTWSFSPGRMFLVDRVAGRGRHRVCRRIHTTHKVHSVERGVVIEAPRNSFRLHGDGNFELAHATSWYAYGEGRPATEIQISLTADLPIETKLTLEVI